MKILIVRLSALGDVLLTLPALGALRRKFPDAQIDWVVEDKAMAILKDDPRIHRLIVYPRSKLKAQRGRALPLLLEHRRNLRQDSYDALIDFQGNLKSAMHTANARAKRKIGYARAHSKEGSALFLTDRLEPPSHRPHRIERAMRLVEALGCEPTPEREEPYIAPDAYERASQWVEPLVEPNRPLVVLHPGTSVFGAYKRWSAGQFGKLADLLIREFEARVLVTWGPGEEELAEAVKRGAKEEVIVSPKTQSLGELGAALKPARLFIGADSAPLHLASFLDVPSVALFGPKQPELYRPYFGDSKVVRSAVPCSPCRRRRCPDALCMQEITVEQVMFAARERLA